MPTLLHRTSANFRVYNPVTTEFAAFHGGRLDIEEGDENYAVVMAEASRNPEITVLVNATTCPLCGEVFSKAKELDEHTKDVHFDVWLATEDAKVAEARTVLIKERAGYACDVCSPPGVFANAGLLALHTKLIHTQNGDQEEPAKESDAEPKKGTRRAKAEA